MTAFDKFLAACRDGNIGTMYRLKAKGQNLNEGDPQGRTGLMLASRNNHLNIATYLVGQGAIVDAADD